MVKGQFEENLFNICDLWLYDVWLQEISGSNTTEGVCY